MHLICIECKNQVDLISYPDLQVGQIIECATCGITLSVTSIFAGEVVVEVVDEGK